MMSDKNIKVTFEEMASILKNFNKLKLKEKQLEFEISNYKTISLSNEDMIETMMFNNNIGERIKSSNKSDMTAMIALSYADNVKKLNLKQKKELEFELKYLQEQIRRIEFYISILNSEHASVLNDLYIECLTIEETAAKESISITSVKNNRRAGIKNLVEMFNSITL